MKYKKLLDPITRNCSHCDKEYTNYANTQAVRYPRFCATCSNEFGKMVERCLLCRTDHFHFYGKCSLCPGETATTYVFAKDGSMNSRSRAKAWREAGENNPGKW